MEGKIVAFPEQATNIGDNEQRGSRSTRRVTQQHSGDCEERIVKKSRSRQRRRRPTRFEEAEVSDLDHNAVENAWQSWDNDETERQQYLLKKKQRALCRELERCRDDYKKGKEWMTELRRSVLGTLKENEEWINVAQYALEQCEAASAMNADLVEENKRLYEENLYLRSLLDRHEISERQLKATMTQKQQQLAKENERLWEAYHVGKVRMKNMHRDQKEAFKAIDFCMRTEVQQKDMQWRKERQQLERRLAKYESQLERMAQPPTSRTQISSDTPSINSGSDRDASPKPPSSSRRSGGSKDEQGGQKTNEGHDEERREGKEKNHGSNQAPVGNSCPADQNLGRSSNYYSASESENNFCRPELPKNQKSKVLPPMAPGWLKGTNNQESERCSMQRSNFGLPPSAELLGPNGSVHDKFPRRNSLKDGLGDFQKKEIVMEKRTSFSRSVSPSVRMRATGEFNCSESQVYEKLNSVTVNNHKQVECDEKDEKSSPSRTETASTAASSRMSSSKRSDRTEVVSKAVEEEYNIISSNVSERLDKLVQLAKRQQESLIVAATSGAVGDDVSCSSYLYQQLLRDSVELEEVADQIRSKMEAPKSNSKPHGSGKDTKMPTSLEPISIKTNRQFIETIPPLLPPTASSTHYLSSSDKSKIDSYNGSAPSIVMDKDGMPVFASLVQCSETATASLIPEAVAVPLTPQPPTARANSRRHHRLRKLRGGPKRGVAKIKN